MYGAMLRGEQQRGVRNINVQPTLSYVPNTGHAQQTPVPFVQTKPRTETKASRAVLSYDRLLGSSGCFRRQHFPSYRIISHKQNTRHRRAETACTDRLQLHTEMSITYVCTDRLQLNTEMSITYACTGQLQLKTGSSIGCCCC